MSGVSPESLARRIHLIRDDRAALVFDRYAFRLYKTDDATYEALQKFMDGSASDGSGADPSMVSSTVEALIASSPSVSAAPADVIPAEPPKPALDRLVLNISNDCNLRCRYCYAQGGSYGGPRGHMDPDTAIASIRHVLAAFGKIEKLQFFGGEPLLNLSLIGEVCRWFERQVAEGRVAEAPHYAVVTNGTLVGDDAVQLFLQYEIACTISLDGPREVTDALRGSGTFDKAFDCANRIMDAGGFVGYEATLTQLHREMGCDMPVLLAFFRDSLGCTELHAPWVSLPPGNPLAIDPEDLAESYTLAARFSLDSLLDGRPIMLSFVRWMLEAIAKCRPLNIYCPAGIDTLAIGPNGDWYPCFVFVGQPEMKMFNPVTGDGDTEASSRIGELIRRANDRSLAPCADCWALGLCTGCLGTDQAAGGGVLVKTGCEARRAMARETMIGAAMLPEEPLEVMSRISNMWQSPSDG